MKVTYWEMKKLNDNIILAEWLYQKIEGGSMSSPPMLAVTGIMGGWWCWRIHTAVPGHSIDNTLYFIIAKRKQGLMLVGHAFM